MTSDFDPVPLAAAEFAMNTPPGTISAPPFRRLYEDGDDDQHPGEPPISTIENPGEENEEEIKDIQTTGEQPIQHPDQVKHNQVISGASTEFVHYDQELARGLADVLERRKDHVDRFLKDNPNELTTVDRFALALTPEKIKAIREGRLTSDDQALAWFFIHDEILVKSLDLKSYTVNNRPRGKLLKHHSILRWKPDEYDREIHGDRTEGPVQLTSTYAETSGRALELEDQVDALNKLRVQLEIKLYGHPATDPFWDSYPSSIEPVDLAERSGNEYHTMISQELKQILAQKHEGGDYRDFYINHPDDAMRALHEANGRALTRFAEQTAQSFLLDKKPMADTDAIKTRIASFKTPAGGNALEQQETLTQASRAREIAEARVNSLRTERDTLEGQLETSRLAAESAQFALTEGEKKFPEQAKSLESEMRAYQRIINQNVDINNVPAMEQRQTAIQNLAKKSDELSRRQDELEKIRTASQAAAAKYQSQQNRLKKLQAAETEEGSLAHAEAQLQKSITAERTATATLTGRQAELEGGTVRSPEKVRGLEQWINIVKGYDKIINEIYSSDAEREFTPEKLAQMGADGVRRLIFATINKGEYTPAVAALSKKMVSDAVIAKAIAKTLHMPADKDTNFADAEIQKKMVDALTHANKFDLGDAVRYLIHQGLQQAEYGNPFLKPEDLDLPGGPTLRPIPSGPENRSPQTSSRSQNNEPLNAEDQRIVQHALDQHFWTHKNYVVEGNEIKRNVDPVIALLKETGADTKIDPTTHRITSIAKDSAGRQFEVVLAPKDGHVGISINFLPDEAFLQKLPDNADSVRNISIKVQESLYDQQGKKRSPEPRSVDLFTEDIAALQGETVDPFVVDARLDFASVDPNSHIVKQSIYAGIANEIFRMPRAQRTSLLHGFSDVMVVNTWFLDPQERFATSVVSFDNGEFMITDAKTKEKITLYDYYKMREDVSKREAGAPARRTVNLGEQLAYTQNLIGREIIKTLQKS